MWGQISCAEKPIGNTKEETSWQRRESLDSGIPNRIPLEQTTGNSPPKPKTRRDAEGPDAHMGNMEKAYGTRQPEGLFQGRDVCILAFEIKKASIYHTRY